MRATTVPWRVLVPVKDAAHAKSRLDHPDRGPLFTAMTEDVLAVAVTVVGRDQVVAVTDHGRGLDGDVLAAAAALDDPHAPVAVLMGDLPAIRPAELRSALSRAGEHERAVVADASGAGTALLTAHDAVHLAPSYGSGSRARHTALGAADLTAAAGPGLRRDVDTADDLAAAVALGVGPATAGVLGARTGATAATYDSGSGTGTALTDAGEPIVLPAGPLAAAGLLRLRPGQRLTAWIEGGRALAVRVGPTR